MPSNVTDKTADTAERDPTRSKGKGKAKEEEPEDEDEDVLELEEEDDDDDEEGEEEEEEGADEEDDEDDMEEIDLENIQSRRTRGKRVDYTSPEALKKAGLDADNRDDDKMQL